MISRNEISSLITLLDDPDPFVRTEVRNRFISLGDKAVPLIDEYRFSLSDSVVLKELDDILIDITFPQVFSELMEKSRSSLGSFEEFEHVILLLSRLDDPTIRVSRFQVQLDTIAAQMHEELYHWKEDQQRMLVFFNLFYDVHGFRGVKNNVFEPEDSFIHHVMKRQVGTPLALSLIILMIGYRLELPFIGLNMPMHFLIAYELGEEKVIIDPYQKGTSLTVNQCLNFLKMNGIQPDDYYFSKADFKSMIQRMIRNLMNSYQRLEEESRVEKLQMVLELFKSPDFDDDMPF